MNWDDYRYFLAVARQGQLKLASKSLGVDQATVGRRLSALHERLGATLLEKRSSGYFLTAAGERAMANIEAVEREMFSIDRAIQGKDERIEGPVKIAMPGAFASAWMMESFRPLLRKYPKLELQFLTGHEVLNLSRREADLAIRLVRPQQRDLKTKKIGLFRFGLYGAKDLKLPQDLSEAPFVGLFENAMSDAEAAFVQTLNFKLRFCMRSAAWNSVQAALQAQIGIGVLPSFAANGAGNLRLLQEDKVDTPLWLVVHPEVAKSARVQVAIRHFTDVLARP